MVHKTLVYELKIFNAIFITIFAIFLACFADLSYGQQAMGQLGGYAGSDNLRAAPAASAPSAVQLPKEDKALLVNAFKERLVKQVTSNWNHPSRVDDAIVKELG